MTDTYHVKQEKRVDARQVELDMYKTVVDKIGKPIVFNVCALGALISLIQLVKPESIVKVLETRTPTNFLDLNKQALDLGINLAEKFKKTNGISSIELW